MVGCHLTQKYAVKPALIRLLPCLSILGNSHCILMACYTTVSGKYSINMFTLLRYVADNVQAYG